MGTVLIWLEGGQGPTARRKLLCELQVAALVFTMAPPTQPRRVLVSRETAAFTDLSAGRGSPARKGFPGSEGSRLCTGTAGTGARATEGRPGTEAAGRSRGRWRCAA